jgi:hypothetical protein
MSLLGNISQGVGDLTNRILNPFNTDIETAIGRHDFKEGFIITEIETRQTLALSGPMMPQIPFTHGGSQRLVKEFYSGNNEPVVQVLGAQERDVELRGELTEKFYGRLGSGIVEDMQKRLDLIRMRGNLCEFKLGEWKRYGFVETTEFNMKDLSSMTYVIGLSIVGLQKPTNAKFSQKGRDIPIKVNELLKTRMEAFNQSFGKPPAIMRGFADVLNATINQVAQAAAIVTNFVDTALSNVEDLRRSVERAKGLVDFAQVKLKQYKRIAGGFDAYNLENTSVPIKYQTAEYLNDSISSASEISEILNDLKAQLSGIISNIPLRRHVVKDGETLQKISLKYFKTADHWIDIYNFNDLESTELEAGDLLEIPRV